MDVKGLNEDILFSRNEWRMIIHVTNPALFSFLSYSLLQVLGIKNLIVIVVVVFKTTFH